MYTIAPHPVPRIGFEDLLRLLTAGFDVADGTHSRHRCAIGVLSEANHVRVAVHMQITLIGSDIAKNVFAVHGIDAAEKVGTFYTYYTYPTYGRGEVKTARRRGSGHQRTPPGRFRPKRTQGAIGVTRSRAMRVCCIAPCYCTPPQVAMVCSTAVAPLSLGTSAR